MFKFERLFVWTGGTLFVSSLILLFGWYAVVLGREHPFAGWGVVAIDFVLFSAFASHHSLLAREPLKAILLRFVPDRLLRATYVWTASLLLILVCVLWVPVGGELYRAPAWLGFILTFVRLVGLWFIARAVSGIDGQELAGIRPSRGVEGLQIGGPYRLVRHPLYLGWMLAVFTPSNMTGDRLLFAAISSLYLLAAMPWEERSLEHAFGERYRLYKREVKWRLFPHVY